MTEMIKKLIVFLFAMNISLNVMCQVFNVSVLMFSDTSVLENIKSEAYLQLTSTHDYDSAILFCNKGINLSQRFGNSLYQGKFLSYKGLAFSKSECYDSAEYYLKEAIRINENFDHIRELSICYSNLGNVYYRQELFDDALIAYKHASKLSGECGRIEGVISTLNNIGNIHKRRGEYPKAVDHYQRALQLSIQNERKKNEAHALENLGNCYSESGNLELALRYYQDAIRLKRELDDQYGIINSLINLGRCYSEQGDTDMALSTYLEGLEVSEIYGSTYQKAVLNSNISAVYIKREEFYLSLHYSEIAYLLNKEQNRGSGIISSSQNMSEAYMHLKQYNKAIQLLDSALIIAQDPDLISTRKSLYETVSDLYSHTGNYEKALEYKNLSHATGDSIMNLEIASQLEEMNIKYETSQKEKRIAVQELTILNQKEDIKHRKQITRMILLVLFVLMGLSSGLLILYIQKRNALRILVRQNVEIGEKEKAQELFSIPEVRQAFENNERAAENKTDKKYSSSALSGKEKRRMLAELNKLMNREQVYLNQQLCIEDVAESLSTNRRYLSQMINESFSMNFSSYINDFRVRKARQLLMDPRFDHLTIEAIGFESGFHSRVAFNNAFKKFTGVTPSFFKSNRNS